MTTDKRYRVSGSFTIGAGVSRGRSILSKALCALLPVLSILALSAAPSFGAGYTAFPGANTSAKPQSKVFFHDGTYWAVLWGPLGVAFYERVGDEWQIGAFMDAIVTVGGKADVKWNGSELFVLVYTTLPTLHKYTYDTGMRAWLLEDGFPVSVPLPSGAETMVLDQDSTGRLWATAEGGSAIYAYYTTSNDHKSWSSTPIVLQNAVYADDISSVVSFDGNKIGVFWSDQNRDQFGFRVHLDGNAPDDWEPIEVAASGSGIADDHVNLATDASGRVYAATKGDFDVSRIHRRDTNGTWTTWTDEDSIPSTRQIVMVSDYDSKVYLLYTRWGVSPFTLEYRASDMDVLDFGPPASFIASLTDANNVTGMKQALPPGSLVAFGHDAANVMWNGWGDANGGNPPTSPNNLVAYLDEPTQRVDLDWSMPTSGQPGGYNVYRQADNGNFELLNQIPLSQTSFTDAAFPPANMICYRVTALENGLEGSPSTVASVLPVLPGTPGNLGTTFVANGSTDGSMVFWFDEANGQIVSDLSGNGNAGRLGSTDDVDAEDPLWTTGLVGTALHFDGFDDYLYVADAPALDMDGSFTIEAWVNRSSATRGALVNKGTSSSRNYRVVLTSTGKVDFRWNNTLGAQQIVETTGIVSENTWHHVACVYDEEAGQNRIYVDGVLQASAPTNGMPNTNTSQAHLGVRLSSSFEDYYHGSIDQFRLVPSALYAADFTPLANPTNPATNAIVLAQWDSPPSGGVVTGYNMYRSEASGPWTRVNTLPILGTAFSDAFQSTEELCYRVTALAQTLEGPASNVSCPGSEAPPLGPPLGLAASLLGTFPESILLQWQPPAGSQTPAGYHVYRQVGSGAYSQITTSPTSGTQFTDTDPPYGQLCYRVSAVSETGDEGPQSDSACQTHEAALPGAPTGLTATLVEQPGSGTTGAAAFTMDEGSGQSLADATGNGHTGQLGSSPSVDRADPTWTSGVSGNGLSFNRNHRVVVSDASDLRFNASFTIEAWARRAGSSNYTIMSKGEEKKRNYNLKVEKSGRIKFEWNTTKGDKRDTRSNSSIDVNSWHHVAVVFDHSRGDVRIYIDGQLDKTENQSGTPFTSSDPLLIGVRLKDGSFEDGFVGDLDLVRVAPSILYTSTFTPPVTFESSAGVSEVQLAWQAPVEGQPAGYDVYRDIAGSGYVKLNSGLVNATNYTDPDPVAGAVCYQVVSVDGLGQQSDPSTPACLGSGGTPPTLGAPQDLQVALEYTTGSAPGAAAYTLNATQGQTVADASDNGNDGFRGEIEADDSSDPTWTSGLEAGALEFDGSNDHVTIPDASSLDLTGSFTVEAWVQRASSGTKDCIMSKGPTDARNFWLMFTKSGYVDFGWETASGANHGATSSVQITDTEWHHLAGVYDQDAGESRVYIDGVLVKSQTDSGTPATNDDPLYLGARNSRGRLRNYFHGLMDLVRVSSGVVYNTGFTPSTVFEGGEIQTIAALEWNPPSQGSATGYNVYRQQDGGDFELLNTTPITETRYEDTDVIPGDVCYQVTAVDASSHEGPASDTSCTQQITKLVEETETEAPWSGPAFGAGPNPFNPTTTLRFRLPQKQAVRLEIFDVRGRQVKSLVNETLDRGEHRIVWSGRNDSGSATASGVYFAVLRSGTIHERTKLILLK